MGADEKRFASHVVLNSKTPSETFAAALGDVVRDVHLQVVRAGCEPVGSLMVEISAYLKGRPRAAGPSG